MEQRLIRLPDPACAAALFDGWQETLIWSALEGGMGRIWALSESPKAALCENADFLFLAGSADEPETRLLLERWREEKGGFEILVPREKACGAVIESVFPTAETEKRYAFHKGGEHFDQNALRKMLKSIPKGVAVVPFDEALYHQALQAEWSRDFVSQFCGADDYLKRGRGFAAVYDGQMVGGASSYTCYSGGIEIQVETRRDWQRRGIASACCAALILDCLEHGMYASWDAANTASVALAKKLGYREAGEYPAWYMDH